MLRGEAKFDLAKVQALLKVLQEGAPRLKSLFPPDSKTGDTRLKAGLPADWRSGDKTGSGDHGTANDVAVLWPPGRPPILVAAYLTGTDTPMPHRNAIHAGVGRAIASAFAS